MRTLFWAVTIIISLVFSMAAQWVRHNGGVSRLAGFTLLCACAVMAAGAISWQQQSPRETPFGIYVLLAFIPVGLIAWVIDVLEKRDTDYWRQVLVASATGILAAVLVLYGAFLY